MTLAFSALCMGYPYKTPVLRPVSRRSLTGSSSRSPGRSSRISAARPVLTDQCWALVGSHVGARVGSRCGRSGRCGAAVAWAAAPVHIVALLVVFSVCRFSSSLSLPVVTSRAYKAEEHRRYNASQNGTRHLLFETHCT